MAARFTTKNIHDWQVEGAVLLPSFFSAADMEPVVEDFEHLYGAFRPASGSAVRVYSANDCDFAKMAEEIPHEERIAQQAGGSGELPFDASPAINLLGLHPALIDFAKAALESTDVRLYQCLTWAKFTGQADFDQPFHMDYDNHTLVTTGDTPEQRTVNFSIYASDVTDGHGAIHYVTRPAGDDICGILRPFAPNAGQQAALHEIERSGAGPIGSVFAYSTDVYHRGTNLTIENGHRYAMFVSYKAANNDLFRAQWAGSGGFRSKSNPWKHVFRHASPEQLACLGVPPPGDPFWTDLTLARAQQRWPMWNLAPWRLAIAR